MSAYPAPLAPPSTGEFTCRLLDELTLRRLRYFPRALAAARYAQEHLDATIRLQNAAAVAGMTASAFSRYFSEKIGLTFSTLVKTLRIARAVEALERGDCAMSIVADYAGYGTGCTLSRVFREIIGVTPSKYRRHLLEREATRTIRS